MRSTLLVLLATVALASASDNFFNNPAFADEAGEAGKGCCLPAQWEGRVGSFYMRRRLLRPTIRMSDSKVGFDLRNKRIAARSMFLCRRSRRVYRARSIADFAAKKAYFIFKDKCLVRRINATMRRPCIPSSFKRFSQYSYGAGSSSIRMWPYGLRNRRLEYFLLVASGNCAPIKGAYRTRRGRRTITYGQYQYYNITVGNTDRALYNIPASCNRSQEAEDESDSFASSLGRLFGRGNQLNAEDPFGSANGLSFADNEPMSHVAQLVDANAAVISNSKPLIHRQRLQRRLRQWRQSWGWE